MRYIAKHPVRGWDFAPYFAYVESVRDRLPDALYTFAANSQNYDLESHTSLHDAWLETFTIHEPAGGQRREVRSVQIDSCYLGPFQDLRIHLGYRAVAAYSLQRRTSSIVTDRGHGDLLLHEVRLVSKDLFEHELLFAGGSTYLIQFGELEHRIESMTTA